METACMWQNKGKGPAKMTLLQLAPQEPRNNALKLRRMLIMQCMHQHVHHLQSRWAEAVTSLPWREEVFASSWAWLVSTRRQLYMAHCRVNVRTQKRSAL